jgi:hypothetical protein
MPYYWVRNSKGQVAAEVSETELSVHDQKLSWQLQRLKEEAEFPFSAADGSEGRSWKLENLQLFLEQNGYTLERRDT